MTSAGIILFGTAAFALLTATPGLAADAAKPRPIVNTDEIEEEASTNKDATLVAFRKGTAEKGQIFTIEPAMTAASSSYLPDGLSGQGTRRSASPCAGQSLEVRPQRRTCDETTQAKYGPQAACAIGEPRRDR